MRLVVTLASLLLAAGCAYYPQVKQAKAGANDAQATVWLDAACDLSLAGAARILPLDAQAFVLKHCFKREVDLAE